MNTTELINFYNEVLELAKAGKEDEARAVIQARFAELPEDVQGDLLARMYFSAAVTVAEDAETIATVQERALEIIKELEKQKEKLEKEGE